MGLGILIKKEEEGKKGICSSPVLNEDGKYVGCGKVGTYRYDNGLPVGYHCDECFDKMVSECRSKSW